MEPIEFEQAKLKGILAELVSLKTRLQQIPRYYGKDIVEQALDEQRQNQLKSLEISQSEPYFGRLDFQEQGTNKVIPLYIGKAGVQDEETNELLIIDWRAPVSSMFYSFTGQDHFATYMSPEGNVEGEIHLKRNIAIRNQILQRVVDSYVRGNENIGVTDEFLLYRLSEHKDNRLQDIVSTIQQEQDRIIRADFNKALIIQGVPGSGKTTVALHRLAYLLYQYQNKIKPEKVIIFAPNKMFIDYISEVLPELGVGEIQQTTFVEWAFAILDDNLVLKDRHQQLLEWFRTGTEQHSGAKGAESFLHFLKNALDEYEATFVPSKGFSAWDQKGITVDTIQDWFFHEYKHYPIMKRKERIIARIKRWIEMEHKEIRGSDPKGLLKKQANKNLNAFKKTWPNHTALAFYQSLFTDTSSNKNKEVAYEDLAPLVYIYDRFHGIESNYKYDHVVIDEAQDFSPFQVALLKEHCPSQSFTILGDIQQNIYAFQGIYQWDEFANLFRDDIVSFYQLDRSYRSTMEIIYFANEIINDYIGEVTPAKAVFRSGEPVKLVEKDSKETAEWIKQLIQHLKEKQVDSIAIVARDEALCKELYDALMNLGVKTNLIQVDQQEYSGGVSIVPIYLTKGMEFDAVVLMDVDQDNYPDDEIHAKLLYVGCTRAFHHLYLIHEGPISPLVRKVDTKLFHHV